MAALAATLIGRMRGVGIPALFGLPGGGGNLDLIAEARRAGLPFVLTATETGSAIAALAAAELTGAPGACLTTLGPGVTSVVNGVATALLDRAPVLVITDGHPTTGRMFAHQTVDHCAVLRPVSRWSGRLAPDIAAEVLDRAFFELGALPGGPVHLDCPGDLHGSDHLAAAGDSHASISTVPSDDQQEIDRRAIEALVRGSRKPVLLAGLGARLADDAAAVRRISERHGLPVLVTYKGKGIVPDDDPWFGGVFTHGAVERALVTEADLLIGVGFDPVEILPRPWTYPQPIISLASWRMAADHVPFRAQRAGSIAGLLGEASELLPRLEWDQRAVRAHVDAGRRAISSASGFTPQAVLHSVASICGRETRITVDAGAHMFAATMLWPARQPGDLLISNGLSTMGFALPAAIGAAVADRERPVIALTGDGGLLICLGELATAVRERLRVTVIVFADASLSLIEIKQRQRGLTADGVALGDISWTRVAEGFGIPAWTAETPDALERVLVSARQADGPALIEAKIDPSAYGTILKTVRG
jgi:acetolactate synthase-1/2/3 large subunit